MEEFEHRQEKSDQNTKSCCHLKLQIGSLDSGYSTLLLCCPAEPGKIFPLVSLFKKDTPEVFPICTMFLRYIPLKIFQITAFLHLRDFMGGVLLLSYLFYYPSAQCIRVTLLIPPLKEGQSFLCLQIRTRGERNVKYEGLSLQRERCIISLPPRWPGTELITQWPLYYL